MNRGTLWEARLGKCGGQLSFFQRHAHALKTGWIALCSSELSSQRFVLLVHEAKLEES